MWWKAFIQRSIAPARTGCIGIDCDVPDHGWCPSASWCIWCIRFRRRMQLRQRSNGCALTLMPLAGWPWPWFLIFFGQFLFSQKCLPPFWWFSMFIGSKSNIGKIFWHFFSYKTWAWAELLARLRCCQLSPDCIANASKLEFDCLAGLSEWVWIPRRGAKRVAESFLHFRSKHQHHVADGA